MYLENPEKLWGCFLCGEVGQEVYESLSSNHLHCSRCGTPTVLTFAHALDLLHDLQREGIVTLQPEFDPDDIDDIMATSENEE